MVRHDDEEYEPLAAPMRAPVMTLRDVSRQFGATLAIDDVSLAIRPGEIHALLGPAGAGKTTLVRILAGLLAPSAGTVRLYGTAARGRRELGASVGLVPSGDTFYPTLSGFENLVFFARLHGLRRREAAARSRALLTELGLEDEAERPVGLWSAGMRARLAIGRARLAEPDVLVLDEASRDLDEESAHAIRMLVSLVAAGGTAVVWTTESVDEIRGFADTVTFVDGGRVRFSGPVARLQDREQPPRYVLRLRATFPSGPTGRAKLQRTLGGTATIDLPSPHDPEHVVLQPIGEHAIGDAIAALAEEGFVVLACRQERSTLEEAFLGRSAEAGA
jgi:ABC-type multidrug transport system ATPase subunit